MHRSFRIVLASAALALACTAPAYAAPPSDASLNQLLEVMHARNMYDTMQHQVEAMVKPMFEQALQSDGDLTPEQRQRAEQFADGFSKRMLVALHEEFDWNFMRDVMLDIYRTTLTQEEVDGMISFYGSPVGQSVITKMPQVTQKYLLFTQQRMGPMMQKMKQAAMETIEAAKSGAQPAN